MTQTMLQLLQSKTIVDCDTMDVEGITKLFKSLDPDFDTTRVCIKIPSTFAGLQACGILESVHNITTLATTLFVIEQAALAGEVGAHYIAPYVNELRVHFDPTFTDTHKAQRLCLEAQRYYEKYGYKTQVLPASLTSTEEIMELAGVHHITISPGLLKHLAEKKAEDNNTMSIFEKAPDGFEVAGKMSFANDEEGYMRAFEKAIGGEAVRKLDDAIRIFSEMQDKFEALMV
ncbi:putative Transaldolase [Glarea lozoyensis 74030]|uniref:Putative Transaldolase n=1 Tax=Glarea lozoyensis (strain ATCC 74030 / MF5533) TaxID=1104152 RepID=H0EKV7_GLAL7|nr:putative Transaldolase [Glarea lozoyensis 74030]